MKIRQLPARIARITDTALDVAANHFGTVAAAWIGAILILAQAATTGWAGVIPTAIGVALALALMLAWEIRRNRRTGPDALTRVGRTLREVLDYQAQPLATLGGLSPSQSMRLTTADREALHAVFRSRDTVETTQDRLAAKLAVQLRHVDPEILAAVQATARDAVDTVSVHHIMRDGSPV